ncbi:MAG: hypothetical protein JWO83_536 [Caulobacteraceae bacterium]|nr:hypothetical protein [Caulobacteraceae bacterium]
MWIQPAVLLALGLSASAGAVFGAPCLLDAHDRPVHCPAASQPGPRQAPPKLSRPLPRGYCANPVTHRAMKCLPAMFAPRSPKNVQ